MSNHPENYLLYLKGGCSAPTDVDFGAFTPSEIAVYREIIGEINRRSELGHSPTVEKKPVVNPSLR